MMVNETTRTAAGRSAVSRLPFWVWTALLACAGSTTRCFYTATTSAFVPPYSTIPRTAAAAAAAAASQTTPFSRRNNHFTNTRASKHNDTLLLLASRAASDGEGAASIAVAVDLPRRSSSDSSSSSSATTLKNERVVLTTGVLPAQSIAATTTTTNSDAVAPGDSTISADNDTVYRRGLATIALITLLFASNSPCLHAAFSLVDNVNHQQPPILLLNAACSTVALAGMRAAGPALDRAVAAPSPLDSTANTSSSKQPPDAAADGGAVTSNSSNKSNSLIPLLVGKNNENMSESDLTATTLRAGVELGTWKMLGTLLNIVGLSLTSAGHGAFLIQLTTLLVPLAQGAMGVPIPQRIWTAIGLALCGVFLFTTQDGGGGAGTVSASSLWGDAACVATAVLYAAYDLRLFHWGQRVEPLRLITAKIVTQTALSVAALLAFAAAPAWEFVHTASPHDLALVAVVALWSGLMVNAVAPFLQVGGQQAVGPARAQILYASQPLWAALLSFAVLGETVGPMGLAGGAAFLAAVMLAATAESPDADCGKEICEV